MKIKYIVIVVLIAALGGSAFYYLEWEKPGISIDKPVEMIGLQTDIDITCTDMKSGVRSIKVTIVKDNQEHVVSLVDVEYIGVNEKTVTVNISPKDLKIKDGEAFLKIDVVDYSPLKNKASMSHKVVIDSIPPRVSIVSTSHNVNPGGTCLVVYKASKDAVKSGVVCRDVFFRGYPYADGNTDYHVCYFAVPTDIDKTTPIAAEVRDRAGNSSRAHVPYYIRRYKFRDDKVRISDNFLNNKPVEFQQREAELQGMTPLEVFTHINDKMRKANNEMIRSQCMNTSGDRLWKGAFLRMKNAKTMAGFGDKRTYVYHGAPIGKSVHLGIDLASVRHAPIQAANTGVVIFAEELGIYGNLVIIDHGQGISSLYSHLSMIDVKPDQQVSKGETIGRSGTTGFAGGDHLHLSVLVGGAFVNPIEWWDAHWIRDNISRKLQAVE